MRRVRSLRSLTYQWVYLVHRNDIHHLGAR